MITKEILIASLLKDQPVYPVKPTGFAFAPSNIALIKYWGKRNTELNLPVTGSLSISLGEKGAHTEISLVDAPYTQVWLNNGVVDPMNHFYRRIAEVLEWIKPEPKQHYCIKTSLNLPVAAGLASSACGFAALLSAFADLYGWVLPPAALSILCRMASGSACRSLWQGFVEWHCGDRDDGLDSFAEPLPYTIPDLTLGLCILSTTEKPISSREAMNRTTKTATLYESWPKQVMLDLFEMKQALENGDFATMGRTAERNALAMHATMLASTPPVCYFLPRTLELMHKVWQLRAEGIPLYFTEDAGPNLKLLARKKDIALINTQIDQVEWLSLA